MNSAITNRLETENLFTDPIINQDMQNDWMKTVVDSVSYDRTFKVFIPAGCEFTFTITDVELKEVNEAYNFLYQEKVLRRIISEPIFSENDLTSTVIQGPWKSMEDTTVKITSESSDQKNIISEYKNLLTMGVVKDFGNNSVWAILGAIFVEAFSIRLISLLTFLFIIALIVFFMGKIPGNSDDLIDEEITLKAKGMEFLTYSLAITAAAILSTVMGFYTNIYDQINPTLRSLLRFESVLVCMVFTIYVKRIRYFINIQKQKGFPQEM